MKNLFLFFTFCFLFSACLGAQYQISDREKAVNKQMDYSAKMLSKKYNIRPCATTVAMPGGNIQYLELEFNMIGPLPQATIRKILINIVHDFLDNINNDTELCSYLKKGCLDISEVGIGLFFYDSKRYSINNPEIGIASISKARLQYFRCDPNDISINGMEETRESYQEALLILQNRCLAVQQQCTEATKEPVKPDKNQ